MTTKIPSPRTADQIAIGMILRGDRAGLARLASHMQALVDNRAECPDCYDVGPHEDNGLPLSHYDHSFACRACGCAFTH